MVDLLRDALRLVLAHARRHASPLGDPVRPRSPVVLPLVVRGLARGLGAEVGGAELDNGRSWPLLGGASLPNGLAACASRTHGREHASDGGLALLLRDLVLLIACLCLLIIRVILFFFVFVFLFAV